MVEDIIYVSLIHVFDAVSRREKREKKEEIRT
jgi:hypothetical protein